jgi:hypothetical protein
MSSTTIRFQRWRLFRMINRVETIEIKLEVGLGSVTKSVVAMCLSNLTADVKNWSSDVTTRNLLPLRIIFYRDKTFR